MAKYHIDVNGNPALCNAKRRPCPRKQHYSSREEALDYLEGYYNDSQLASFSKKPVSGVDEAERNFLIVPKNFPNYTVVFDGLTELSKSVEYKNFDAERELLDATDRHLLRTYQAIGLVAEGIHQDDYSRSILLGQRAVFFTRLRTDLLKDSAVNYDKSDTNVGFDHVSWGLRKYDIESCRAFQKSLLSLNDPKQAFETLTGFLQAKKSILENGYDVAKEIGEISSRVDITTYQEIKDLYGEIENAKELYPKYKNKLPRTAKKTDISVGPEHPDENKILGVFKTVTSYLNPRGDWESTVSKAELEAKSAQAVIEAPKKENRPAVYYSAIPEPLVRRAESIVEFSDESETFEGQLLRKQLSDLTRTYSELSPDDQAKKKPVFESAFEKLETIYKKQKTIEDEGKTNAFDVEAQYIENLVPESIP